MTSSTFSVTFNSDILTVKHFVGEALNYLCEAFPDISSEDFFDFKLLMMELLTNAVIHGNNNDSSKKVSLDVNIVAGNSVLIRVADEGSGFDVLSTLNSTAGQMAESGRGIKIINSLVDKISSNRFGNEIKIYKKVVSHE